MGDRIFCEVVVTIKFGIGGKKIGGGLGWQFFLEGGRWQDIFLGRGGKTFSGWGNKHFYGGDAKKNKGKFFTP